MATELHLAKDALTLHFLFKRLERLIDIVVTNQNLHLAAISCQLVTHHNWRAFGKPGQNSNRKNGAIA